MKQFFTHHVLRLPGVVLVTMVLVACQSGPDYRRPAVEVPTVYKWQEGWKPAEPRDLLPRAAWWETFGDGELNALMGRMEGANFNVQIVEARYRQARALADGADAAFSPTLSGNASASRSGSGGPGAVSTRVYRTGVNLSWEIDLWGRLRRNAEARAANLAASAADVAAARLSVQAELARNYFRLRLTDAQKRLFDTTLEGYQRSLEVTRNRYNAGLVARSDVLQAEAQMHATQVQSVDLGIQRARLENAIAVLLGRQPAALSLPFAPLEAMVPRVPQTGLASELLERRPDIAAAERDMAAANAQIGVAAAANYPSLNLGASAGLASATLGNLINLSSSTWSIAPALAMTLIDGGARRAQTAQATAAYDATVAGYRQTVLNAFREVEDALAQLRVLEEEAQIQQKALATAREVLRIAENQYRAGLVSYLNVVTAQASALSSERTTLAILGARLDASVALIAALGGGWSSADMAAMVAAPAPQARTR